MEHTIKTSLKDYPLGRLILIISLTMIIPIISIIVGIWYILEIGMYLICMITPFILSIVLIVMFSKFLIRGHVKIDYEKIFVKEGLKTESILLKEITGIYISTSKKKYIVFIKGNEKFIEFGDDYNKTDKIKIINILKEATQEQDIDMRKNLSLHEMFYLHK